ncbi:MAG: methyl-coenzyme M reductase glutamine C-methyltransferase [Methanomicrobiales archaeon]
MHVTILSPDVYTYGAMVIGGILRDAGLRVTLRSTLEPPPEGVAFLSLYSTLHLLDPRVRACVARCREAGVRVYVGGPVSTAPRMVMGELDPDAVVVGEGEEVVVPLAEQGPSPDLPGIACRDGDGVVVTGPAPPASLDRPLPLIPDDIGGQDIRGASAYIETHRGCTGACTFCQVPRFFGREIRSREIRAILEEVRAFRERGARRISVSGGTGSLFQSRDGRVNTDAFVALLQGMADIMGPKNVSSPDIRVDCINDEILEAIRRYTVGWIFFGIESGSDRILRLMGKGQTVARVDAAIEECRNHGIRVAGSLIAGYPTETTDEYRETKDALARWMLDDVFISSAEPIPGTPLAALVRTIPREENPAFVPHTGEYRALHLMENEARAFDLMQEADLYKPGIHVVTGPVFDAYLAEARRQGADVRAVTALLEKYPD